MVVLFKELFQNVQALILQNGPNGATVGLAEENSNEVQGKRNTNPNPSASLSGVANGNPAGTDEVSAPAVESLNEIRSREIASKAVSGILLTLLKWFKLSRTLIHQGDFGGVLTSSDIMKYEYLTQLLLDANFMPLVLKYFAHQDIDRAVEQRNDRKDLE